MPGISPEALAALNEKMREEFERRRRFGKVSAGTYACGFRWR